MLFRSKPPSYRPISKRGNCRLRRVSSLLMEMGEWNETLLRQHFSRINIEEIQKIKTSPRRAEDVLAWAPDPRGILSVRSAYSLAWDTLYHTSTCAASRAPDGNRGKLQQRRSASSTGTSRVFSSSSCSGGGSSFSYITMSSPPLAS